MRSLFMSILITLGLCAQDISNIGKEEANNFLEGGLGLTTIDGKTYTTFTLSPELSFGKFGLGLNLELLFDNEDGFAFREEMYEGDEGYLRAIRYLRWGLKGDSVYARVGTIDNGMLGNGFLMFHYTNGASYESRKIGASLDLDFNNFGFESIYSNFARAEIIGFRGYYRPLVELEIPIIRTMELGATYITDMGFKRLTTDSTVLKENLSAFGMDISFKIIDSDYMKLKTYIDYGQINNHGYGTAYGALFLIPKVLGVFELGAKYEIRSISDGFIPNLFTYNYDILRDSYQLKDILDAAKSTSGHFGEIAANILNTIVIRGSYTQLTDAEMGGLFYAEAELPQVASFEFSARYSKGQLEDAGQIFKFDERSLAEFELGYQINSLLLFSTTYRYTWEKMVDENGLVSFEPQERILPQIKFRYQF